MIFLVCSLRPCGRLLGGWPLGSLAVFGFDDLSCLYLAALWSPAGWLASWLSCILCFRVWTLRPRGRLLGGWHWLSCLLCFLVCTLRPCGRLLGGWPLGSLVYCVFLSVPCGLVVACWEAVLLALLLCSVFGFVVLSCLYLAVLWSRAGRLASWLSCILCCSFLSVTCGLVVACWEAGLLAPLLCFVFGFDDLSCLYLAALWSPAGRLASWLSCCVLYLALKIFLSVPCSLVVVCWESGFLALLYTVFSCVLPLSHMCLDPHQNWGWCLFTPPPPVLSIVLKLTIPMRTAFVDHFCYALFSVHYSLVSTCWEMADFLALLCVMFSCFCHFLIWCLGSGVVHACIDYWSLPS